jgi:ParB family chromosome partitioning protein
MAPRKNFMGTGPSAQEQQARRESVEALFTPRLAQHRVASQDIPIARIQSNPFQARTTFDATELEELAQAIRELGFTSRLRVRPHPQQEGAFQLVYGERRLRAAALAGLEAVPCDIAEHTDDDLIEIGLAENIQRRDLNPIEEANAFQNFIDQRGYSIRRLAERIGKDKSYLEGRLALLRAPADVQTLVAQRPDTLDAARQLSKLPLDERQPIISALIEGTMTSRDVRALVRSVQSTPLSDPPAADATILVTPGPSVRADRIPDPHATLVRSVQRDRQAISAILKRWQMLRTGGAAQQAIIDEVLEAVLVQISTMNIFIETVEESL